MSINLDRTWMWHPHFTETRVDTAGLFVHFRRRFILKGPPPASLKIHITADTRYKLYINCQQVAFGPVKGDQHVWFYDEVDIAPFLQEGQNHVGVHVLRFFHATSYAPSFPRLPSGGVRISVPGEYGNEDWGSLLTSSEKWETAVDTNIILRVDEPEDHFLHIYERASKRDEKGLKWVAAKVLEFKSSTGNAPPWNLEPRMLPPHRVKTTICSVVRTIQSTLPAGVWEAKLIQKRREDLVLPAGTRHILDLEMAHHVTAFALFSFKRPAASGAVLKVLYSESYEDEPEDIPWTRRKADRCDYTKGLFGPQDVYELQGRTWDMLGYRADEATQETIAPFHFRTFRFLRVEIEAGPNDLALLGLEIETVNYPLEAHATFKPSTGFPTLDIEWGQLWDTSVRTLKNCMHDCYEDCPMYEQLQYAMDVRSSALFTYLISRDDRLARQAIVQLHNSFAARRGITGSRAPSHRPQFIPHFSLYWVCMVADHLTHFGDEGFVRRFLPVVDSVLAYFQERIGGDGLVRSKEEVGTWQFVDWVAEWKPHGIPPAVLRTAVSTFTNQLYAYSLSHAAELAAVLGREGMAGEYRARATATVKALRTKCYDGRFFADTTADTARSTDYSVHCQVWAVLCGAVAGVEAQDLLRRALEKRSEELASESVAMSFYTMRALSLAGGSLYDENFHAFWEPWRRQLGQNVTTWVEDDVSQRSDCHAWGCVPIYEAVAEVLGVRNGHEGVEVRPRLGLFRSMQGRAPLQVADGKECLVRVSWMTEDAEVKVSVGLEGSGAGVVPIRVLLPGKEGYTLETAGSAWNTSVKRGEF